MVIIKRKLKKIDYFRKKDFSRKMKINEIFEDICRKMKNFGWKLRFSKQLEDSGQYLKNNDI